MNSNTSIQRETKNLKWVSSKCHEGGCDYALRCVWTVSGSECWAEWSDSNLQTELSEYHLFHYGCMSELCFSTCCWRADSLIHYSHFPIAIDSTNSCLWQYYIYVNFNGCDFIAAGDEGSSSGSGSGCSDGCTTEFVFVGTEAPVIGADRSDERAAAAAAGNSLSRGPSLLLVMAALTLPLWIMQTQWR